MNNEDRLRKIIEVAEACNLIEPVFETNRFFKVFSNLIQEYLADRIWTEAKSRIAHPTRDDVIRVAFEIAREWFSDEFTKRNMPFAQPWLKKYIDACFVRYSEGVSMARDKENGKKQFGKMHPKEKCEWYLGCPTTETQLQEEGKTLHIDHKWPLVMQGALESKNCMWLCEKHNVLWKGKLIFWGENEIPCGFDFKEEDN